MNGSRGKSTVLNDDDDDASEETEDDSELDTLLEGTVKILLNGRKRRRTA